MKTISCVIPAYNEEKQIDKILDAVLEEPLISEVIVVDDGSKDNTKSILSKRSGIKVLTHGKNQGKNRAIVTGFQSAKGEYILMLDADLIGVTKDNLSDLIRPVAEGLADISMSNREKVWRLIRVDPFSGDRVLPKKFLMGLSEQISALQNFGIETFLDTQIIKQKLRIRVVPWKNVRSPIKWEKYGFWRGIRNDLKMYGDILSVSSPIGLIRIIIGLHRQLV